MNLRPPPPPSPPPPPPPPPAVSSNTDTAFSKGSEVRKKSHTGKRKGSKRSHTGKKRKLPENEQYRGWYHNRFGWPSVSAYFSVGFFI